MARGQHRLPTDGLWVRLSRLITPNTGTHRHKLWPARDREKRHESEDDTEERGDDRSE